MKRSSHGSPGFFLPDFCTGQATLLLVLIAELTAFMLTAVQGTTGDRLWFDLGRFSLFLQWITLSGAAELCLLRPYLARMPLRKSAILAYLLLLSTTLVISLLTYVVAREVGISSQLLPEGMLNFVLRTLVVSAIMSALLLRYFYVQHQWKHNVQKESRARIAALQARIRPHFLFNSMNTIAALIRSRPEAAEHTIEDLADLFRASLSTDTNHVLLTEELSLARQYVRIETLRLGNRLRVDWQVGNLPLDARAPRLILQPLLENAIYHGIEPLAEGGVVTVEGSLTDQCIVLQVSNPVAPTGGPRRRGNRMALENIQERLELAYPGGSIMEIDSSATKFCVSLRFPYRTKDNEDTYR